jgi:hypothetical protein
MDYTVAHAHSDGDLARLLEAAAEIQVPAGIKQIRDVRHTKKEILFVGDTNEVVARLSLPTSG